MADYLAAYREANGKVPDFRLVYVAGWVQFRSRASSMVFDRKRPGALVSLTKRLRERAAAVETPDPITASGRRALSGEASDA